jgi:PhnB protein
VKKMPRRSLIEQLDEAVQTVLARPLGAHPDATLPRVDARVAPLLRIAAELRDLPREDFKARLKSDLERKSSMTTLTEPAAAKTEPPETKQPAVAPIPKGYRTVTPYLVAQDAAALIDFVKKTFGAEEKYRGIGSAGGFHCEVQLGDSMMMIGGGGPGLSWRGAPLPGAFHIYVPDCDAVYQRALQEGATSIDEPADQFYGERSASVKDAAGNYWYIATFKGESYKWEGAPDVQPYLHPLRVEPVINFLKSAFGAEELGRHGTPDGVIHHATVKIGDSYLEMGEAHGPYQPMSSMFYLYVPDVDALYRRALAAGATSISEPADQSYGDRSGGVKDAFGNQWYIATHIKDVTP